MIYSDVYAIADHDFTTSPLFGERRSSALRSGFVPVRPIPSYLTLARAQVSSSAIYVDISGTIREIGADSARIAGTVVEARNLLRNPRGEGLSSGTPGTLPTNWSATTTPPTGITRQVIGAVTVDGAPGVRIKWSGTAGAGGFIGVSWETNTAIPASVGEVWTASAIYTLAAGTFNGLSVLTHRVRSFGGSASASVTPVIMATPQRAAATVTMDASTTHVRSDFVMTVANGASIDVTIDFAVPQIERASTAGPISLPPVGILRTSTRYGTNPGRLLIEGQRTNLVANTRTPAGNGWTNTGLDAPVSSTGVDGAAGSAALLVEDTNTSVHQTVGAAISFLLNQRYTFSALVKAGTCTTVQLAAPSAQFGSSAFANFDLANGVVGTAGAAVTRHTMRQLNAGWWWCEFAAPCTTAGTVAGVSVNMTSSANASRAPSYTGAARTLELGWVWIEAAPFASTPALPPIGSPASATVGGDNVTLPYTALETDGNRGGTHVLNAVISTGATEQTGIQTLLSLNDGVGTKKFEVLNEPARTNIVVNPRAEGAVAGTPGTRPTGWSVTAPAGYTITLNGIDTSHGIPLLDYSVTIAAGTATSWGMSPADPAASALTSYTGSWLTRVVSGTAPPGRLVWQDGGTTINDVTFPLLTTLSRASKTFPSSATATIGRCVFQIVPDGVSAYTFRFLVGAPQVEVGTFATSPLLPPVGAPAASSRAANTLSIVANDAIVTNLGTFTPGATTKLALGLDGLGRAAGSLNNGLTQSLTGGPNSFDLTTVRLGSSLAGARPMRLELIDWAHVPFVYSDDTTKRL